MSKEKILLFGDRLEYIDPTLRLHQHMAFEEVESDVKDEIEELRSEVEFLREQLLQAPLPIQVTTIREIDVESAIPLVLSFVKKHEKAYPSDIAAALGLDMDTTLAALDELSKQGKVK